MSFDLASQMSFREGEEETEGFDARRGHRYRGLARNHSALKTMDINLSESISAEQGPPN